MSAVPQAEEPVLIREDRDGICTLTMNRPKQMNLLTSEMIGAIQDALDSVAQDAAVHAVVLGANGKGFCAGHDLKEIRALAEKPKVEALFRRCARMMLSIAAADFAFSRSTNFWILPVEVFGSSPNTTARGALKRAMFARQ